MRELLHSPLPLPTSAGGSKTNELFNRKRGKAMVREATTDIFEPFLFIRGIEVRGTSMEVYVADDLDEEFFPFFLVLPIFL